MKKKLLRSLGVLLCAAMLISELPAHAFAAGDEPSTSESCVSGNSISENSISDNNAEENILLLSDEELDKVLNEKTLAETGEWLLSLTQEEFEDVINRNTVLSQNTVIKQYQPDETAGTEEECVSKSVSERTCKYYEWAMENAPNKKMRATYFKNNGKCFLTIHNGSSWKQIGIDITDIDGDKTDVTRLYNIAITGADGSGVSLSDTQRATRNQSYYSSTEVEENPEYGDDKGYKWFTVNLRYTKPIGYKAAGQIDKKVEGTSPLIVMHDGTSYVHSTLTYTQNNFTSQTDNGICLKSIYKNFNIGLVNDAGENVSNTESVAGIFAIYLTRPAFTIAFNGNGATSGSVASQKHYWDESSIAFPGNGYVREYTVNFNGNGGISNAASAKETWSFAGWGKSSSGTVTNGVGGNYTPTSFTSTENAALTYYAIWNKGTVTLPSASRTGYTFGGWYNGTTYKGTSGNKVTFGANTNLTAKWTANPYTVQYMSDGNQITTQQFTYDTAAALKTAASMNLKKAGYVFDGWNSSSGVFTNGQTVKNLVTSGSVTLNARWKEATDTPYTVVYKMQKGLDDSEYIQNTKMTKVLKGTTGSTVSVVPEAVEGYVTPEVKQVTINADGSSVVEFLYKLIDNRTTYTVKHLYTNPVSGKEVEYKGTFEMSANDIRKEDGFTSIFSALKGQIVTPETSVRLIEWFNEKYGEEYAIKNKLEYFYEMIPLATKTVTLSNAGEDIITYVYEWKKVKREIEEVAVTNVVEKEALSDKELNRVAEQIAAGLAFEMTIDGVNYEMVQMKDGSFSVKLAGTDQKNVTVPDTVKIAGKTYHISEVYDKAFYGNKQIESVTVSKGISKINSSAFEGCSALKKVTMYNGLTEIGNKAFKGCSLLTSIKLPSTVRTIGTSAFENCTKLSKVTLNGKLLKIGSKAFKKCSSLSAVKIPNSVLAIGTSAFENCKKLKKVTFSKSDSQCYSIGNSAFKNCTKLSAVILPDKLTKVPQKGFYGCKKLKSVSIGSKTREIGKYAFKNCCSMSKVTIGGNVTVIGISAFDSCRKLTSVTLPANIRRLYSKAFYNCSKLKKVTIKGNVLTSVGKSAFKKCKKGIQFKVPAKKLKTYKKLLKGKY